MLMFLSGSLFRPFVNYTTNYYFLVDPGLQAGARYSEFKGMIENFSYRAKNTITVIPTPDAFQSFKRDLLDFLELVSTEDSLVKLTKASHVCVVALKWRSKSSDEDSHEAEIASAIPSPEHPINVFCSSIIHLFDEKKTSSYEMFTALDELYRTGVFSTGGEATNKLASVQGINDCIILKPAVFGLGIDLNALLRRLFTSDRTNREKEV
jgi:hypothetical protein